ncbi:hypothetical protein ACB092_11G033900 [Castanea dentata]
MVESEFPIIVEKVYHVSAIPTQHLKTTSDYSTNPNKKTILTLKFFQNPALTPLFLLLPLFGIYFPNQLYSSLVLLYLSQLALSLYLTQPPFYLQLQLPFPRRTALPNLQL